MLNRVERRYLAKRSNYFTRSTKTNSSTIVWRLSCAVARPIFTFWQNMMPLLSGDSWWALLKFIKHSTMRQTLLEECLVYRILEMPHTDLVINIKISKILNYKWKKKRILISFTLDSTKSAEREITIFFKEFNMKKWYNNEEIFYNLGKLHFDPISFVHTIDENFVKMQNELVKK